MRQLLPVPADVDPAAVHGGLARVRPDGRPWVLLNMVASLDGATALDGVSGGLGSAADKEVFAAIRAVADVILVAAGTVRAESYGPPRTPPARQAERRARGQAPFPRLAIVTASLDLDPTTPLFTEAPEPPLVLTVAGAPPARLDALAPVAEVVALGARAVDPVAAIGALADRGARVVVVEGGPRLNGQLLAADLVDELDLTLSPLLVGGGTPRLAAGAPEAVHRMALAHLWAADDLLLTRYVRV